MDETRGESWSQPVAARLEADSQAIRILAESLADQVGNVDKLDAGTVLRNLGRAIESISETAATIATPRALASVYQGDYRTEADIWFTVRDHLTAAAAGLRSITDGF